MLVTGAYVAYYGWYEAAVLRGGAEQERPRVRAGRLAGYAAATTWGPVHAPGVHATVAGVLLASAVPVVRSAASPSGRAAVAARSATEKSVEVVLAAT
jgi:Na+/H+ antiporter NhaA